MLVVINPTDKEISYEYNVTLGRVIYKFNGEIRSTNGNIIIPPCSASYVEIKMEESL